MSDPREFGEYYDLFDLIADLPPNALNPEYEPTDDDLAELESWLDTQQGLKGE